MAMKKDARFKVYQASAGAGKTFTLIKEYLKLCLKSEEHVANFKNILAITFTNAAANEMKAKIVSALCGTSHIQFLHLIRNMILNEISGEIKEPLNPFVSQ